VSCPSSLDMPPTNSSSQRFVVVSVLNACQQTGRKMDCEPHVQQCCAVTNQSYWLQFRLRLGLLTVNHQITVPRPGRVTALCKKVGGPELGNFGNKQNKTCPNLGFASSPAPGDDLNSIPVGEGLMTLELLLQTSMVIPQAICQVTFDHIQHPC
jgi:hypothetical protein